MTGEPQPGPEDTGPEPAVGTPVRDTVRDRVGIVIDREGPYLQLRPLGGGREWDADPSRIQLLTQTEVLSARVAQANARSRQEDR